MDCTAPSVKSLLWIGAHKSWRRERDTVMRGRGRVPGQRLMCPDSNTQWRPVSTVLFLVALLAINDLVLQAGQKHDCLWLKYSWWIYEILNRLISVIKQLTYCTQSWRTTSLQMCFFFFFWMIMLPFCAHLHSIELLWFICVIWLVCACLSLCVCVCLHMNLIWHSSVGVQ